MKPIRCLVFPDRPECLLLYVPEGQSFTLPTLSAPFSRVAVAMALGDAKIPARVAESTPGRWTSAMTKAKHEARSEASQRETLRMSTEAALMRGSADLAMKERGELIQEKLRVDARIRELKTEIGNAKSAAATRGRFMDPQAFRSLEAGLRSSQERSLAIQSRLGELRAQEKSRNVAAEPRREQAFIAAAKEILDGETIQEIWDLASENESSGDESEAAQ